MSVYSFCSNKDIQQKEYWKKYEERRIGQDLDHCHWKPPAPKGMLLSTLGRASCSLVRWDSWSNSQCLNQKRDRSVVRNLTRRMVLTRIEVFSEDESHLADVERHPRESNRHVQRRCPWDRRSPSCPEAVKRRIAPRVDREPESWANRKSSF